MWSNWSKAKFDSGVVIWALCTCMKKRIVAIHSTVRFKKREFMLVYHYPAACRRDGNKSAQFRSNHCLNYWSTSFNLHGITLDSAARDAVLSIVVVYFKLHRSTTSDTGRQRLARGHRKSWRTARRSEGKTRSTTKSYTESFTFTSARGIPVVGALLRDPDGPDVN